jgi:hypothetical protein
MAAIRPLEAVRMLPTRPRRPARVGNLSTGLSRGGGLGAEPVWTIQLRSFSGSVPKFGCGSAAIVCDVGGYVCPEPISALESANASNTLADRRVRRR